jgi:hypothetical protein
MNRASSYDAPNTLGARTFHRLEPAVFIEKLARASVFTRATRPGARIFEPVRGSPNMNAEGPGRELGDRSSKASSRGAGRLQRVKHPGGSNSSWHRILATRKTIRAWAKKWVEGKPRCRTRAPRGPRSPWVFHHRAWSNSPWRATRRRSLRRWLGVMVLLPRKSSASARFRR